MERHNGLRKANRYQTEGAALAILFFLVLVFPVSSFAQGTGSKGVHLSQRLVLISVPDRKLAVIEDGSVMATFAVAVGAQATPSPTGEFTIVSRVANPTYYHSGTVIPAGTGNPLGTRWVGLSQKGYGIHGTNAPGSIGHARSHGCIRLRNRDMERLFTMLQVGDVVQIRGERDEQIAQVFGGAADETALADVRTAAAAPGQ